MIKIKYENLTIRQAEVADAKQLAAWWNDGAVMAHAGFPNGLGTTEEEVIEGLGDGRMVIEENNRLIGECNYREVVDGIVEISIKICESDCQNRGVGRKVLSMLIGWLFRNGYTKIILDTNLMNTRAQHVYESLGFRKVRINMDSWKDQLGRLQSSVDYELVETDFVSYIIINFIPATENDAISIIELRKKIWSTTYRGIYPDSMLDDFDYEWHKEKELQRIKHLNYAVYLIVKDNLNIGYLTIRKTDIIILQSLYILEEYQHQGIGKMAFDFVKNYCMENGINSFVCHCVPENWSARMFYEKMGGRVIGEDLDNEESWMNSVIYRFDSDNQ